MVFSSPFYHTIISYIKNENNNTAKYISRIQCYTAPDLGQMRPCVQLSYDAPYLGPEGGRPSTLSLYLEYARLPAQRGPVLKHT